MLLTYSSNLSYHKTSKEPLFSRRVPDQSSGILSLLNKDGVAISDATTVCQSAPRAVPNEESFFLSPGSACALQIALEHDNVLVAFGVEENPEENNERAKPV